MSLSAFWLRRDPSPRNMFPSTPASLHQKPDLQHCPILNPEPPKWNKTFLFPKSASQTFDWKVMKSCLIQPSILRKHDVKIITYILWCKSRSVENLKITLIREKLELCYYSAKLSHLSRMSYSTTIHAPKSFLSLFPKTQYPARLLS